MIGLPTSSLLTQEVARHSICLVLPQRDLKKDLQYLRELFSSSKDATSNWNLLFKVGEVVNVIKYALLHHIIVMIIEPIQFPEALKNLEFGEELHYFFPTQH